MSLQTRLAELIAAIGADIKVLTDNKADSAHVHAIAGVTGLQSELDDINSQLGDIASALDAINGV